jgi:hypothetical protein
MDTAALPFEVSVTDLVTAVPIETLPNAIEDVLRLSEGVPKAELEPLSLIDAVFDVDPCVAVRVTVCAVVTAETVAVNEVVVAPEGTDTEAGTETAALLLARLTTNPVLGAAPLNETVQLSAPAPIMDELEQLRLERDGVPEFDPRPWSLVVLEDLLTIVDRLVVLTLSVPVESAVDLAS